MIKYPQSTDEFVKLQMRFLKDLGIYAKVISIRKGKVGWSMMNPVRWFTDFLCFPNWTNTEEGYEFWWGVNLLWYEYLIENTKLDMHMIDYDAMISTYVMHNGSSSFGDKIMEIIKKRENNEKYFVL